MTTQDTETVAVVERASATTFGLYEVRVAACESTTDSRTAAVDVVLFHGLTGDPFQTWGGTVTEKGELTDCWPRRLAVNFKGQATIWTAQYPAPLLERQLGIIDRSFENDEAKEALTECVQAGLGTKPIIFLAHSLGGLLVKAMLSCSARALEEDPLRMIFEKTHAVIFVGTPHCGSGQARWRSVVPTIAKAAFAGVGKYLAFALGGLGLAGAALSVSLLGGTLSVSVAGLIAGVVAPALAALMIGFLRPGRHVLLLDPANPGLYRLTNEYRRLLSIRSFFTDSFYEMQRLWWFFLVVPRWSADPGVTDCEPTGIHGNHFSICRGPQAQIALTRAIEARIQTGLRGKAVAVFSATLGRRLGQPHDERLNVLTVGDGSDRVFVKEFKSIDVGHDRRKNAEEALRRWLRGLIVGGNFAPKQTELDLALISEFDIDGFVWDIWQERELAVRLRTLRKRAYRHYLPWVERFAALRAQLGVSGATVIKPSLIPFYRCMRTIEHTYLLDSSDEETKKSDFEELLALIREANTVLAKWSPQLRRHLPDGTDEKWIDGTGATRHLLRRMEMTLVGMKEKHDAADSLSRPS